MDLRRLSHLVRLPETAPVKSATYNKMIWRITFKKFYASPFKTVEHSVNQILPAKKTYYASVNFNGLGKFLQPGRYLPDKRQKDIFHLETRPCHKHS